ncbi:MAG: hypothetical protein EPN82_12835 [Bacteroidetes bacterium]|nr:MAG: hypothetical protein EPN82_12835 [Bacteroidota bacterium]
MKKEEFKIIVEEKIGNNYLSESGAVLYSSLKTTEYNSGPTGRLYFMGTNPGGNPQSMKDSTINKHLEELNDNFNEYINGIWNREKGQSPLQLHIKELFDVLHLDLENTFSTNLIFKRSSTIRMLNDKEFKDWADMCWDFHLNFFIELDTKIIITNGIGIKSTFMYIKNKQMVTNLDYLNSGYSNWRIGKFDVTIQNKNMRVIGLPHLSYYSIKNKIEQQNWISVNIGNFLNKII